MFSVVGSIMGGDAIRLATPSISGCACRKLAELLFSQRCPVKPQGLTLYRFQGAYDDSSVAGPVSTISRLLILTQQLNSQERKSAA